MADGLPIHYSYASTILLQCKDIELRKFVHILTACAGIIAGVVVGCFGLLSLLSILAAIFCIIRWHKKSSRASPDDKGVQYEVVQSD